MIPSFKKLLFLLALAFFPALLFAQVSVGPEPSWVKVLPTITSGAKNKPTTDVNSGYYLFLFDRQENAGRKEFYSRQNLDLVNSEGVSSWLNCEIEFNPSFQQVVLHHWDVYRNGEKINKLATARKEVIQRETNLNSKIFNGRKTLLITVSDLRPGDIIDYSYTVKGDNPIFAGRYNSLYNLEYSLLIKNLRVRILSPSKKVLHHAIFGDLKVQPKISQGSDGTEYVWEYHLHKPKEAEVGVPYDVYQWSELDISEFNSWTEVVDFHWAFYSKLLKVTPAIRKEVERLTREKTDLQEKVMELVRFVQDEIQYMGFEVGINSHKPNPPDYVLSKRYGDCKDKSLLLCSMLQVLGVEAWPNLIASGSGPNLISSLPGYARFDHVTTSIFLDGKQYFVDPTISNQGGQLDQILYPAYGYTLLIKPGESSLIKIDKAPNHFYTRVIEALTVKDSLSHGGLEVHTVMQGWEAERFRNLMLTNNPKEIQKEYEKYYANTYDSVKTARNLIHEDKREENQFSIWEKYTLGRPWIRKDGGASPVMAINPNALFANLVVPSESANRKFPYALRFPFHFQQTIRIRSDGVNPSEPDDYETIENEYVRFSFFKRYDAVGQYLEFDFDLEHKSDRVPPEAYSSFVKDMEKIKEHSAYTLSWKADEIAGQNGMVLNYFIILFSCIILAISLYGAYKLYQWDPPPQSDQYPAASMSGALVFVGFTLVSSPLLLLFTIEYATYFDLRIWNNLTLPDSSSYHSLWGIFLVLDLIANSLRLIFTLLAGYLYLKKRTSFPTVYVAIYWFSFFYLLFDTTGIFVLGIEETTQPNYSSLISVFVFSLIWTNYFKNSDQPRKTFVNRLEKRWIGTDSL